MESMAQEQEPPLWAQQLLETMQDMRQDMRQDMSQLTKDMSQLTQDMSQLTTCVATLAEADIRDKIQS
jgi:prefoldin subunit 5